MKFYTRRGDDGKVRLKGNKILSKDDLIFQTLGELDELNSLIGLAKNYFEKTFEKDLTAIQNDLFLIQAIIASKAHLSKINKPFPETKVKRLEKQIDLKSKNLLINSFIIPGSNKTSAWFDYLRTVTRRTERFLVKFHKKYKLPLAILAYLNRLSSFFYVLARYQAKKLRLKEKKPGY